MLLLFGAVQPDCCHPLQANVLESYDKLQEWSYFSETLTVGDSSASKAAMLYLCAKAHQVCLRLLSHCSLIFASTTYQIALMTGLNCCAGQGDSQDCRANL